MTLARHLLMGAGGAGAFMPPRGPFVVTTPTAGGWTQIPEAHAVYDPGSNTTFVGYVDGTSGNVEIVAYDNATGITSAPTVLHAAISTPADTHCAPGLLIRDSDKRIIVAYSGHNGPQLYVRVSTNPQDISAFNTEETLHTTIGGTAYTYPILIQRLAESGQPIYLWYRDYAGGTSYMTYTKATDVDGGWWSTQTHVYANPGHYTYWKITSDGQWRIDFAVTDDNPQSGPCSIWHFYADATDYHQSDGTAIGAYGPPFNTTHLTLVYDTATSGPAWPTDLILDGSNNPRMVYPIDLGTDAMIGFARWTGSAWAASTVVASIGKNTSDPVAIACLDASVLAQCHLSRYIGSQRELWRYTTGDSGATWSGASLTPSPADDNTYPTAVKGGHPPGFAIAWLAGTYTFPSFDQDNSLGIKGIAQ